MSADKKAIEGHRFQERTEECQRCVSTWLSSNANFGLPEQELARLGRADFAYLACSMYSQGDLKDVFLAAKVLCWITALDDTVDEEKMSPDKALDFIEKIEKGSEGEPLSAMWKSVLRFAEARDDEMSQRAETAFKEVLQGFADEARYRGIEELPPVDAYRRLRVATGGMPLFLWILESGLPGRIPWKSDIATSLEKANYHLSELTTWVHDLWTFEHDREKQNTMNLVLLVENEKLKGWGTVGERDDLVVPVLASKFQRKWQKARQACRQVERMADFLGGGAAAEYAARLPHFVVGALDWQHHTQRYKSPQHGELLDTLLGCILAGEIEGVTDDSRESEQRLKAEIARVAPRPANADVCSILDCVRPLT